MENMRLRGKNHAHIDGFHEMCVYNSTHRHRERIRSTRPITYCFTSSKARYKRTKDHFNVDIILRLHLFRIYQNAAFFLIVSHRLFFWKSCNLTRYVRWNRNHLILSARYRACKAHSLRSFELCELWLNGLLRICMSVGEWSSYLSNISEINFVCLFSSFFILAAFFFFCCSFIIILFKKKQIPIFVHFHRAQLYWYYLACAVISYKDLPW